MLWEKNDIYTQIYVESGKMGKKFNYADKLNIPYVIIIGEEEVKKIMLIPLEIWKQENKKVFR